MTTTAVRPISALLIALAALSSAGAAQARTETVDNNETITIGVNKTESPSSRDDKTYVLTSTQHSARNQ